MLADKVIIKMNKKGIFCGGGRSYISAVHTDADLDKTVDIFEEAVKETLIEERLI
jgi:glutamate-1-semialdehyde aminotransferase